MPFSARRTLRLGSGILFSLMLSCPALADAWTKAQSDHFVIYSNIDAKTTAAYANKLEQYRYVLGRFYGVAPEDDADNPRFTVYFLRDHYDLAETQPGLEHDVDGYYTGCIEGSADFATYHDDMIRDTRKVTDQDENLSQTVMFHEYAHAFMFQHTAARYPRWFVEGFAEYYGSTKIQDDQVVVGMASSGRYRTLQGGYELPYEDLLRSEKSLQSSEEKNQAFYAQSWLLTHYMLATREREDQLRAYMTAYNKHEDPVAAFETATGIQVKDLSRILNAYLASKELTALVFRLKDMPVANKVDVTTMPASARKLLLWDGADRVCTYSKNRPQLLDNIRKEAGKYPDDSYAQLLLARAENIIGDESKALPYLKTYTAAHPDDAEALFLLGQSYYLMSAHNHIIDGETRASQMEKAREDFGAVYKLDPTNPTNLYYFAQAHRNLPDFPDDNTVNAAVQAHDLAPSIEGFAILAANLLIQKDRPDDAESVLYPLASNPHNVTLSSWASAIIAAIDRKAPKAELLVLIRSRQTAPVSPAPKN